MQVSTCKVLCNAPTKVAHAPNFLGQAFVQAKAPAFAPEQSREDVVVLKMHKSMGFPFNILD